MFSYDPYNNSYYYTDRSEMNMMDTDKMEEMRQMMMEHMETTKQIKQQVERIEEQLRQMEIHIKMQ